MPSQKMIDARPRIDKIGPRPAGRNDNFGRPGVARFGWRGRRIVDSLRDGIERMGWLRRDADQHRKEQAAKRLPVENRGWLACELRLHEDKPSLIRLSTENGGGCQGLMRGQASGTDLGRTKSTASMGLASRCCEHATALRRKAEGNQERRACIGVAFP